MSVVRLMGGLGNQLFQYAFARRLALETGEPVSFDVDSGFRRDPYGRALRLHDFKTSIVPSSPQTVPFGVNWPPPWHRVAKAYWTRVSLGDVRVIYERRPFIYDQSIYDKATPESYYYGYWQHEGYFRSIRDVIVEEFSLRKTARQPVMKLALEMSECVSISVHVRDYQGGDGRRLRQRDHNIYGICSTDYYENALKLIGVKPGTVCYIFSDNPKLAKARLRLPVPCRYVSDTGTFSDVEEIVLMSKCKHHIIANSSYSWWGAWLGGHQEKTVVAPYRWLRTMPADAVDICPKKWKRL